MREFVEERGWSKFHTPRNVLLALTGEVGELAECFQWRGDAQCEPGLPLWTAEERLAAEHELADVFLYLTRLADLMGSALEACVLRKLAINRAKYNPER